MSKKIQKKKKREKKLKKIANIRNNNRKKVVCELCEAGIDHGHEVNSKQYIENL